MPANTNYQGSQAFAQSLDGMESVNPNTGTLSFNKQLLGLRGPTKSSHLKLNLGFAQGALGVYGLPSGWSLNLPFVIVNGTTASSLTMPNATYQVDPNWNRDYGVRSGLAYVNKKGVYFATCDSNALTPLAGKRPTYTYTSGDGRTWYFDANGRLIEHCDLFGVGMVVTYRESSGGLSPDKTLIDSLQIQYKDGSVVVPFGPALTFHYSGGTNLAFQLGATEICSFRWDTTGVARISEEGETSVQITNGTFANQPVINQLQYWSGLTTKFDYQELPYYDGSLDNQQSFAAIQSHVHLNPDGSLLGRSDYAFGDHTAGNTFTGFKAKLTMSQAQDALIEAANPDFQYDASIKRMDEKGRMIGRTDVYYNAFHAPVQTDTFADPYAAYPSFRLRPGYDQVGRNALTARNFNLPVSKMFYAIDGKTECLKIKETYTYSDYGKRTERATYLDGSDTVAKQENHTFDEPTDGRSTPQDSDFYDAALNRTTRHTYSFNGDRTALLCVTSQLAAGGPGGAGATLDWSPWKKTEMTYDDLGRVGTRTASWADGYPGDKGAVATAKVSFDHTLDGNIFTTTATNAAGASTSSSYDLSIPTGPQVSFTNAVEEKTSHTYDDYGNLLTVTTPSNLTTAYSYTRIGVNGPADGVNSVSSCVQSSSYTVCRQTDPLDRLLKLSDNGTGTATLDGTPDRVLRAQTYDPAGRLASSVDELKRKTQFTYDGLGRLLTKTRPDTSAASMTYDEPSGACRITVGGTVREVRRSDPLGRLVGKDVYPIQGSLEEPVSHQTTYSGFGKPITQRLVTYPAKTDPVSPPPQGSLQISSTFDYDADGKLVSILHQGADQKDGQETQTISRDLLGNVTTMTRVVVDANGNSSQASSEAYTFDNTGALVTIESDFGGTESRMYDAAGRIGTLTLPDSAFQYTYENGALMRVDLLGADGKPSGDSVAYGIDDRGLIASVTAGDETLDYGYLPDGALGSVTYPDLPPMSLVLDGTNRVTTVTDPYGVATATEYDDLGRIATRSQNGTVLSFAYSGTPQRLDTVTFSGKQAGVFSVAYDDFDQPAGGTLKTGDGKVLLDVAITRDWADRTSELVMSSEVLTDDASVNLTMACGYDVLGRLASRTVTPTVGGAAGTTVFAFDAAGNLLSQDGPGGNRSFDYNTFNQLKGGAVYDGNGRMTDDGQGRTYAFDAWDRLISKDGGDGGAELAYWPDGALKSVTQDGVTQSFVYLGGAVTSTRIGDATTGMLRAHGTVHATTGDDGTTDALLGSSNGSTAVTLSSGSAASLSYGAFGQADGTPAAGLPTWNQELQLKGSDLSYLRARWHSPEIGRFVSADPSLQLNRYAYTDGDPTNQSDPTGLLSAFWDTLLIIGLSIGLEIITDGLASAVLPELDEAAEGAELSSEANGIAEDRAALQEDNNTLGSLKRLTTSGDDAVSRSTAELEQSVANQEEALAQREAGYAQRMSRLRRFKRLKFLENKWIMSPIVSVTEDAIHRAIKGEPMNREALESFGLDIVLSEFFVGLKFAPTEREGEGILMHTLRGLPSLLVQKAISSSVHRAFDLGGLSYIPPVSIVANVFHGIGSSSGHAGGAFEGALGASGVPVRLDNADGLGGSARPHPGGAFASLSAKGAISNAQTLADALQSSVFKTGRALHAAR